MTLKPVQINAPIVESLRQEFKFSSFDGGFDKGFGFEGVVKRHRDRNGFAEFHVLIPRVKVKTDKKCDNCKGTGRDRNTARGECLYCDGYGIKHDYKWHEVRAISASLTVLFSLIDYTDIETRSKSRQLLTVHTITDRGQHGGSLGGMYSVEFVDWLSHFKPNTKLEEMGKAMKLAYGRMLGRRYLDGYRFSASVDYENGWLNVSCPGDACGLNPSDGYLRPGSGYEFSCHNTDSPAQQLTLLAGLAALHDKARKEMIV